MPSLSDISYDVTDCEIISISVSPGNTAIILENDPKELLPFLQMLKQSIM
jgi:hypothetical protein